MAADSFDRVMPALHTAGSLIAGHQGLEDPIDAPVLGDLVGAFEEAAADAGQGRCAECGCLEHFGAHDPHTEQVGLELHQQVVGRCAAIDSQFAQRFG